jgi:hypothetical protein
MSSYSGGATARRCCTSGRRSCREDGTKLCTADDYDDDWRDTQLENQSNLMTSTTSVNASDSFDQVRSTPFFCGKSSVLDQFYMTVTATQFKDNHVLTEVFGLIQTPNFVKCVCISSAGTCKINSSLKLNAFFCFYCMFN